MDNSNTHDEGEPASKKTKLLRACDYCRRKKIKCDGPQKPNHKCSRCVSRRTECTYVEPLHKNFYPASFIESMENRLQKMEKLLHKLNPEIDLTNELDELSGPEATSHVSAVQGTSSLTSPLKAAQSSDAASTPENTSPSSLNPSLADPSALKMESQNLDPSDDESELRTTVIENFSRMAMDPIVHRYHGKSSGLIFVHAVQGLKDLSEKDIPKPADDTSRPSRPSKKQFPWLKPSLADEIPTFEDYPAQDLTDSLVDLYFRKINDFMPLLHEPTFKQGILDGQHLHHGAFGATVLLVCANGARFSADPRVFLDETEHPSSAGWKWFYQVERVHKSFISQTNLYDLQIHALMACYVQGSTIMHASWMHIGIGLRMAIDMGAHRKKTYGAIPTVKEELMKRAFWVLVVMDWVSAYVFGRPCSVHDEDMDLGLPIDCDDEFWTTADGQPCFQQPQGTPSKIAYFNSYIRLCKILAFSMRTIYSINKSKWLLGNGNQQWEQRIVTELDSALNRWVDSVPSHLRWDTNREHPLFLKQSVTLLSHYYHFQIDVHRPFISTRRNSSLSFPSLIICTNAARSGIRVVYHLYEKIGTPLSWNAGSLFMFAIVLLLNVWGQRRSGHPVNVIQDLEDVRKCIQMIKAIGSEMHTAEYMMEVLQDFLTARASFTSQPAPAAQSTYSADRAHTSAPQSTMGAEVSDSPVRNRESQETPTATRASVNSVTPSVLQTFKLPSPTDVSTPSSPKPPMSIFGWNGASYGTPAQPPSNPFALPLRTEELAHARTSGRGPPQTSPPSWASVPVTGSESQWQPPTSCRQTAHPGAPMPTYNSGPSFGHDSEYDREPDSSSTMTPDAGEFERMFGAGLEPFGSGQLRAATLQAMPGPSTFASSGAGGFTMPHEAEGTLFAEGISMEGVSELGGSGMQDFALTEDTLSMWSHAPAFFELDDWGAFLDNVNNANQPSA